jgi:hypothetical protein
MVPDASAKMTSNGLLLADGGAMASAAAGNLTITEITDASLWGKLLATADCPQLTQSFTYGAAKAAKGWHVRRICLSQGDVPVALCQILERRVLGLRLVSRINRGPLLLGVPPSAERILAVYRTIRSHWGRWYSGPLSIAPGLLLTEENAALLRRAGYICRRPKGWWSGRIDLTRPHEAIRAGLASTFRNRLRGAEQSGVALRVASDTATIDWMIARHTENMQDKKFSAVDAAFLRKLHADAPEDFVVFQAIVDGEPVAGMSVIRFGDIAEYHTGWFGPEGRKVNAGNFLMWSIMAEMKARGCAAFDVGGLYEGHGYTQFKRGMRAEEYRLVGEWVAF